MLISIARGMGPDAENTNTFGDKSLYILFSDRDSNSKNQTKTTNNISVISILR